MGSDSDFPTVAPAIKRLKGFGIPVDVRVMSAHRTPDAAAEFSKTARDNGFGVTILDGHSVDGTKREVVFVQLRRKRVEEAMKIALSENPEAIISVSEAKTVHGGFFSRSSK